jgi:DNA-binding transcriptional ArsR family regulator
MVTQETGVFQAVADPTRRAILDRLRQGGQAVNEIAGRFEVSRPAISKHLRVLLDANLVTESREGRHRVYKLNPGPLREVDRWIEQYRRLWAINLQNLKAHVEQKTRRPQ